jgi:hypothetical protein
LDAVVRLTVFCQYADPVARVQPAVAVSTRSSSGRVVQPGAW